MEETYVRKEKDSGIFQNLERTLFLGLFDFFNIGRHLFFIIPTK